MDLDQLKLILDTLNNVGDGAKEIAFLWIAADFLKGPLAGFSVIGSFAFVAYVGCRAWDAHFGPWAAVRRMRDHIMPSMKGTHLTNNEVARVEQVFYDRNPEQ